MIRAEILHPVVALAAWTMIMWAWMYAKRIPALGNLPKDDSPDADVGWTSAKLEDLLPRKTQWIAHNYNHLHEAPTVFYAVAIVLAITGNGDGTNAMIAWAYVFLRVIHSLVQALVNKVMIRFGVFTLSSIALIMLIIHAYMAVI